MSAVQVWRHATLSRDTFWEQDWLGLLQASAAVHHLKWNGVEEPDAVADRRIDLPKERRFLELLLTAFFVCVWDTARGIDLYKKRARAHWNSLILLPAAASRGIIQKALPASSQNQTKRAQLSFRRISGSGLETWEASKRIAPTFSETERT